MIKQIQYNGITVIPADNICQDGDTEILINAIPEDGQIKPISPPEVIRGFGSNRQVVYVHKTADISHYIIWDKENNTLLWSKDSEQINKQLSNLPDQAMLYQIIAVGNTLMALTNQGISYFLWKGDNIGYAFLGNHIPELPISFGLQGEMIRTEEFTISFDEISLSNGEVRKPFSDNNKKRITEQVAAKVNKFIAEHATNSGKFIYPFFVRYAYRLYDGTLTMHSSPVLMICSSDLAPQCFIFNLSGKASNMSINEARLRLAAMTHQLDYKASPQHLEKLQQWSDIVKSVDIFISKPIYTYDQNGEATAFSYTEDGDDCLSICKNIGQKVSLEEYPPYYQVATFTTLYKRTYPTERLPTWRLMLPRKDEDQIKMEFEENYLFYFLSSIPLNSVATDKRKIIEVKKDILQSLVNREVMTDDYQSHDHIIAKQAFGYNNRINLTDITKTLANNNTSTEALFPYTDGDSVTTHVGTAAFEVFFFIKQNEREIITKASYSNIRIERGVMYLYHPNPNCYKAIIKKADYIYITYAVVYLKPHNHLNGAYFFGDKWDDAKNRFLSISQWNSLVGNFFEFHKWDGQSTSSQEQRKFVISNKIYTSEVNNPFLFPPTLINTLPAQAVIGLSSAAKALSQGQFGQFPLYAFTTDGVWALQVANNGAYIAKQPITRDVCINPASITQIDTAVLFTTKRGVMLLQGSDAICITDGINNIQTKQLSDIIPLTPLRAFPENMKEMIPFNLFMENCQMLYDYTHQRVFLYNKEVEYTYVFSLKSKQWGIFAYDIDSSVNAYPEALAMTKDGELLNFSKETEETILTQIIVTRPIKLEQYDVHKTIKTIIQRGVFCRGNIKSLLYASNDLINWIPVWSSTDHTLRGMNGTPYKYFKITLIANLKKGESITGCSIDFQTKYTNKLR